MLVFKVLNCTHKYTHMQIGEDGKERSRFRSTLAPMDEPAFQAALERLRGSDGFNASEFIQPGKKVEATLEQAAFMSFTVSMVHHLTFWTYVTHACSHTTGNS